MVSMRNTGPMKQQTARRIRRTAELVDHHQPETVTGGHLRDAATMISSGYTESAKRHLDAAMEVLTPRNLVRHGILDDEGHATAKHHMHEIHRHRLAVQDIEDVRARNDDLRERAAQASAARKGGPERGAVGPTDTGTRSGPPRQLQVTARTYTSWDQVTSAIELAFWKGEPRLPTGEWTSVHGGSSAQALHGKMVHGLTGHGRIVTGTYNHKLGQVTVSPHTGAIPVVRIKAAVPKASAPHKPPSKNPFKAYSSLANEIQLAFAAMAWEHETRDPHTGKWSAGAATLDNVRTHLENAHGFGHSFPDQSNEHLLARHAALHQSMPMAQNHHHVIKGGGTDSAYGQMRARRDALAAASAPAFTAAERGRMGLTGPERIARGRVKGAPHSMGYSSWEEVSRAIELSARTGMLAVTPAPRGRPGGPGLYHVKGLGHTPYFQQVVKALIDKRGMAPDKAYAVAYGALRKWRRGGGHVHPEVAAAATGALAGEAAKAASAHSHTADPGSVIELFNPNHAPTGQFTTASGAGQKQPAGQKQKPKPGAGKGMAGKTPGSRARLVQRAKLQRKASGIRSQIAALLAQLPTTHHAARSKSATPAKKGAAATSAKAAAASKAAAKASTAKRAATHKTALSPATIHAKINALRAELAVIRAQIRAL